MSHTAKDIIFWIIILISAVVVYDAIKSIRKRFHDARKNKTVPPDRS